MKNLSFLLILMACNPAQVTQKTEPVPNPCGIPEGVVFNTALIETHQFDSSHCVEGENCVFADVNTHTQLLKFNYNYEIKESDFSGSGLEIELTQNVALPSPGFDAAISNPEDFNCYVNEEGPYGCSGSYYISFPTNADLVAFRDKCGI